MTEEAAYRPGMTSSAVWAVTGREPGDHAWPPIVRARTKPISTIKTPSDTHPPFFLLHHSITANSIYLYRNQTLLQQPNHTHIAHNV